MYRLSRSEKLVIIVVMNGWPATAARVFLSFLMCSTCFKRMTATLVLVLVAMRFRRGLLLSTLRRIFNAKTF